MDAKETLALLESHPLTQQIRAEKAAKVLEMRTAAAAKIEQLKEEAETVIPQRVEAVAAAEGQLQVYDEGRRYIVGRLATARAAVTEARQRIEGEKAEAEAVLLSNYVPRIDTEIQWFRNRHEALLQVSPDTDIGQVATDPLNLTKTVGARSNAEAIRGALTYCLTASRKLEAMRFEPVFDATLIDELKRGVPSVGEMLEVTHTTALPAVVIDERALLKSDSQLDWEIGRLLAKCKKILRQ